jgi:peroxiredoxin Q/BCP
MHHRVAGHALAIAVLASSLFPGCGSGNSSPVNDANTGIATTTSAPILSPREDLIPVGQTVPDFEATDHRGQEVRLSELLKTGRVVLVFYPKDNTPVCTKQLCALRDDWSEFQERQVAVLGINPADKESHAAFASKHGFPFPVLVDRDSRIAAAFGVKGTLFTKRTVYVIDRNREVILAEGGVVPHDRIFAALDRE